MLFHYTNSIEEASEDRYFWTDAGVYHLSQQQYESNVAELNAGFTSITVPLTFQPAYVGPNDRHLSEHATAQVMRDLATRLIDGEYLLDLRAPNEAVQSLL